MRKPILIALLLSTAPLACGVEGIEVRQDGVVLDVLHTARYATGPLGREPDFEAFGDVLVLTGHPADPGPVRRMALTLGRPIAGGGLTSAGPYLGQGLWLTDEGVEIGVDDGQGIEIEGRLRWSGPIPRDDTRGVPIDFTWSH